MPLINEKVFHVYFIRYTTTDSQETSALFVETDPNTGAGKSHQLSTPNGHAIYECKSNTDPIDWGQLTLKEHIGYTPQSSHPHEWDSALRGVLEDRGYRYHSPSEGVCSGCGPVAQEVGTGNRKRTRTRTRVDKVPTLYREDARLEEMGGSSGSVTWVTDCAIPVLRGRGLLLDTSCLFSG